MLPAPAGETEYPCTLLHAGCLCGRFGMVLKDTRVSPDIEGSVIGLRGGTRPRSPTQRLMRFHEGISYATGGADGACRPAFSLLGLPPHRRHDVGSTYLRTLKCGEQECGPAAPAPAYPVPQLGCSCRPAFRIATPPESTECQPVAHSIDGGEINSQESQLIPGPPAEAIKPPKPP
jgi:hypothetical protein